MIDRRTVTIPRSTILWSTIGLGIALGVLAVIGVAMLRIGEATRIQAQHNEVEVLRHRVNEREGHYRLCSVALSVSGRYTPQHIEEFCSQVLGKDFYKLKKELFQVERKAQDDESKSKS